VQNLEQLGNSGTASSQTGNCLSAVAVNNAYQRKWATPPSA